MEKNKRRVTREKLAAKEGIVRVNKKIKKSQLTDFKDKKFYMSNEPCSEVLL